jgi:CBS-domain-containing membrane protein
MNASYHHLPQALLAPGSALVQAREPRPGSVNLEDRAELVYTDLSHSLPFTVNPTATIEQVNDKMIACGVRLLFVTDSDEKLHGLVTHSDLFGDKPVRYIKEHGGSRSDILAQDIMTALLRLETLDIQDVLKARVGDIVETIKAAGRQHILVCATGVNGQQTIVGLFSSTHLEKLLGAKIEFSARAQNFADLERALT